MLSFSAAARKRDVLFIMGADGREAPSDILIEKEITKEVAKLYAASNDVVRIAVIAYGQAAHVAIPFTAIGDNALRAIDSVTPRSYGRNIEAALTASADLMVANGNAEAERAAIVFYNKPVQQPGAAVLERLAKENVRLISIGIGREAGLVDGSKITGKDDMSVLAKSVVEAKHVAGVVSLLVLSGAAGFHPFRNLTHAI